jgi:hypothetical protein
MKLFAAVSLICAMPVGTARGQVQESPIAFGAGFNLPTGEFHADDGGYGLNVGWMLSLLIDGRPDASGFGFRVTLSVGENTANDRMEDLLSASVGRRVDAKIKLAGGIMDAMYIVRPSERGPKAYVFAGAGFYNVAVNAVVSGRGTGQESEINFAANLGAGLSRPIGASVYFIEARHVWITDVFDSTTLSCLPVTLGVRWRF